MSKPKNKRFTDTPAFTPVYDEKSLPKRLPKVYIVRKSDGTLKSVGN